MNWQDIGQQIVNTKVPITEPWVWVGVYVIGMFAFGVVGTRKLVTSFTPPADHFDRTLASVFALIVWIFSPAWMLINILLIGVEKAFNLKRLNKD